MQLTEEEDQRVEAAISRLKGFAVLEGDAVPLAHDLFITNGTDLTTRQACAILFSDNGTILYHLTRQELQRIKETGQMPILVEIHAPLDQRGQDWWNWWVRELS